MTPSEQSLPHITRAVVPAAGLGTRMRPLTNAIPKEMLPLGRKPVLEYVLEELRGAGITDLTFVISPGKEMIRNYFGDGGQFGVRTHYATQAEMRGLGDALLHAESQIGENAFIVAFGDCLVDSMDSAPLRRLMHTHIANASEATVLTERIPRELTRRYGIVDPAEPLTGSARAPFQIRGVIEKPEPRSAPSDFAVAARWALNPGIFGWLRRIPPSDNGELNLTDAVQSLLKAGFTSWAVPLLEGEFRRDIGEWESYLSAAAAHAMADQEFGRAVRATVCEGAQR